MELEINGFKIVENIFTETEINQILSILESSQQENPNFRKTKELFAIRNLLQEFPALQPIIFNQKIVKTLKNQFKSNYFLVKAIFF